MNRKKNHLISKEQSSYREYLWKMILHFSSSSKVLHEKVSWSWFETSGPSMNKLRSTIYFPGMHAVKWKPDLNRNILQLLQPTLFAIILSL
jgi:hypothetical protein